MAKVTLHETPSEAVVKSSKELVYVTDSRGRKLGLRRLDFLEEFKIIETVGSETASNTTYMSMLNPLLYLAEIDGNPVEIPRSKLQVDGLIQRAGREGFLAVVEGITRHFAGDAAELEGKIKNGDGTPA